jgi:hypothetical protein
VDSARSQADPSSVTQVRIDETAAAAGGVRRIASLLKRLGSQPPRLVFGIIEQRATIKIVPGSGVPRGAPARRSII